MADYEETISDDISKQSKFNSGALITLRLNELINDSNKHARNGELAKWNADLERIWCELVGDIEIDSPEYKLYKKFREELAKLGTLTFNQNNGFNSISENQQIIRTKQNHLLQLKEEFLRKLINQQGKGTAYEDSSSDYMD